MGGITIRCASPSSGGTCRGRWGEAWVAKVCLWTIVCLCFTFHHYSYAESSVEYCETAPVGVPVDRHGCACDNDADRVANFRDRCPNSEAGAIVDHYGCVDTELALLFKNGLDLQLSFSNDSADIISEQMPRLDGLGKLMQDVDRLSIVIEGHTDYRGMRSYNQQLSERRAEAARVYLLENFKIAPERVSIIGHGELEPKASNLNEEGRAENRRVVARIRRD